MNHRNSFFLMFGMHYTVPLKIQFLEDCRTYLASICKILFFFNRDPWMLWRLIIDQKVKAKGQDKAKYARNIKDHRPPSIKVSFAKKAGERIIYYCGKGHSGVNNAHQSSSFFRRTPNGKYPVNTREGKTGHHTLNYPIGKH